MKGIILMHVDKNQEEIHGPDLKELIEINMGLHNKIYNLPHWEDRISIFEPYRNQITTISYRTPENSIGIQWYDCKLQIINDNINYVEICGQRLSLCIRTMKDLLEGKHSIHNPLFEKLEWPKELYHEVLKSVIPTEILYDLSMQ
ncbi:MAG: hypothetical protein L6408_02045 [Nanoarchaeota archaeon]|nr:hypothetical protein [Nanoarchaeota archaeon]